MKHAQLFMATGGLLALAAVILGAFGAHALAPRLQELDTLATWKTAVDYQMWHALALLLLAAYDFSGRTLRAALSCFCAGVCLFSGSLYWLALDGPRWLGPVTPLGGLLLISGWSLFIVAILKHKASIES